MSRLRRALVLLAVLLIPTQGWAAVALVEQNACVNATTATATCTLANVAAGNLVVVSIAIRTATTITGAADDIPQTWTCPAGADFSDTTTRAAICYFENSAAAAGTFTVTVTLGDAQTSYLNVSEWSGAATSSALDQVNESADTGSPYTHGSITTTSAGVIITASAQNAAATETVNASFTELTNTANRDYFQYWITNGAQTTTGEYTAGTTFNTSGVIASFKEAAVAGGPPVGSLMLLGVGK